MPGPSASSACPHKFATLIPNGQHSSDSTLRLGLKLFHRLRSGAFGTPLADQQRKATRVYSPSRSALHGSQRQLADQYLVINLLRNEMYMELSCSPQSLEAMVNMAKDQSIVIIDEVQRIPLLLNEVHRLIEERKIHFLLTGSSARNLIGCLVS
ncbi:AAA family ATPase [Caedibacter taeniospiralis]|uniref:AAA family ATPase n=1 Tax=Caedibacter taeniospiralis TaxID=28907 RepID=UPI0037BEDC28